LDRNDAKKEGGGENFDSPIYNALRIEEEGTITAPLNPRERNYDRGENGHGPGRVWMRTKNRANRSCEKGLGKKLPRGKGKGSVYREPINWTRQPRNLRCRKVKDFTILWAWQPGPGKGGDKGGQDVTDQRRRRGKREWSTAMGFWMKESFLPCWKGFEPSRLVASSAIRGERE